MELTTADLFEVTARRQLYVEGVKSNFVLEFNSVVRSIAGDIRKLFATLDVETMDELTSLEVRVLINKVTEVQDDSYGAWLASLLLILQQFSEIDFGMMLRILGSMTHGSDTLESAKAASKGMPTPVEPATVWSRTTASEMFATGVTLAAFLRGFVTAAKAQVLQTIRMGVAGASRPSDVLRDIVAPATGPNTAGVLTKLPAQSRAVMDTVLRHASQQAAKEAMQKVAEKYQWVSVMDARTTDICRKLNGKIFEFNHGPVPPAHINCRSSIVALLGKPFDVDGFNLYQWVRSQSDEVIRDLFGDDLINEVASGKVSGSEIDALLRRVPAMSLNEYQNRAPRIYTGK